MVSGVFLVALSLGASTLRAPSALSRAQAPRARLFAVATEAVAGADVAAPPGLLARERYVACNQFNVRPGAEAKFEARWANRKSRLAELDGFRYFNLMRRVSLDPQTPLDADDFGYVSLTIWETKQAFNSWRTGDAFKEAHGGTSIGAFLGAMISSLRVLKGPPRPIFFDGLLQLSAVPTSLPPTEGGWRVVQADGQNLLPAEAFIACNRFSVLPEMAAAFEQRWAARESKLDECEGFVSFSMLRRDFGAKGHGVAPPVAGEANYQSCTVWKNKACFLKWRDSQQFRAAHGDAAKPAGAAPGGDKPAGPPPPMWSAPPKPAFYEGVLVLSSTQGA
ncbi:hypothetical protein KFE25_003887 [Diacronema lutheri]|uniref:ABM domain-containing protein n=1 Tax=Diacronema lutheri TaxID=2081491 RepID=A0A8J6C8G3_DIALT|nr:hypothetical protein KFE25_003887 [Diacronema lutheri]